MLPAHHKPRPHAKTNGVYLCAIISLALCLFVTFRYWKREVNELLLLNQQLRDQLSTKGTELVQGGELLHQSQNRIKELESDLSRRESTISDLTASVEKEAAKSSELQKNNEQASREFNMLEQLKSETDSRLEACEKDLLEQTNLKDRSIEDLQERLKAAKSQISILTADLQKQKDAIDALKRIKSGTSATGGTGTTTATSARTEVTKQTEEARTGVVEDATTVKPQEKQPVKTEALKADEDSEPQHVTNVYRLEAPDRPENVRQEGSEHDVTSVHGDLEGTTGLTHGAEVIENPRSGSQGAQAETLNDALNIEAKEEIGKEEDRATVV